MKRALLCLVLAACPGAPPISLDPEPIEDPVRLPCASSIAGGMLPTQVEDLCGPPSSKIFARGFPDAVVWSYCGEPCRRQQRYLVVFYGGKVFAWGPAYEAFP